MPACRPASCRRRSRPLALRSARRSFGPRSNFVIGRGHYHWQHEPCWYAVRKGKHGHWVGDRKQTTVWRSTRRRNRRPATARKSRSSACAGRSRTIRRRAGGLRAVQRLRHDDHRRRDDRARVPARSNSRRPMSMSRSSAGRTSPAPLPCTNTPAGPSPRSRLGGPLAPSRSPPSDEAGDP